MSERQTAFYRFTVSMEKKPSLYLMLSVRLYESWRFNFLFINSSCYPVEREGVGGMLSVIISTLLLLLIITLITGNLFGLSTTRFSMWIMWY